MEVFNNNHSQTVVQDVVNLQAHTPYQDTCTRPAHGKQYEEDEGGFSRETLKARFEENC